MRDRSDTARHTHAQTPALRAYTRAHAAPGPADQGCRGARMPNVRTGRNLRNLHGLGQKLGEAVHAGVGTPGLRAVRR